MAYFEDHTVEMEVDGEKLRVFYLEADLVKKNLEKAGKKVKITKEAPILKNNSDKKD